MRQEWAVDHLAFAKGRAKKKKKETKIFAQPPGSSLHRHVASVWADLMCAVSGSSAQACECQEELMAGHISQNSPTPRKTGTHAGAGIGIRLPGHIEAARIQLHRYASVPFSVTYHSSSQRPETGRSRERRPPAINSQRFFVFAGGWRG